MISRWLGVDQGPVTTEGVLDVRKPKPFWDKIFDAPETFPLNPCSFPLQTNLFHTYKRNSKSFNKPLDQKVYVDEKFKTNIKDALCNWRKIKQYRRCCLLLGLVPRARGVL